MSDNGPEVYKVIGAPGTGKTTRVVGNPELELDGLFLENNEEYPLEDQMFVTYTNAGVDEAADRLYRMTDWAKTNIQDRVTTIHSRCYSILDDHPHFAGLNREQVVQHWHKQKWCSNHNLEFGWDDDEDDIMGADQAEGNMLFQIYDWLQNNRMEIEQWEECPNSDDWTGTKDPEMLMNQWEQYKREENLVGFGDMIIRVLEYGKEQLENLGWSPIFSNDYTTMELFDQATEHPKYDPEIIRGKGAFIDTRVLYVDEVQDLTPVQWEWYLLQKLVCEKVYIGGDDDQTIYGWSGANPEFMLNEEGDFEVLDKTYRIPREIWDVCDGVIRQVDERQNKDVIPDGEGGEVHTYRHTNSRDLIKHIEDSDDVFALFRARFMIDEFRNTLHKKGIPYRNMSTYDTWSDDIVKLTRALGKIKQGEDKIKYEEVDVLMEYMADEYVSNNIDDGDGNVMNKLKGVDVDKVHEAISTPGVVNSDGLDPTSYLHWAEEDGELNYYEKEAVQGVLRNETYDLEPDNLRLGTIHSAKGKEAKTVILALDTTQTIAAQMHKQIRGRPDKRISDAERRVYYVGMTRASEELVLCEGLIDPEMTIKLNDLLGDYDTTNQRREDANTWA